MTLEELLKLYPDIDINQDGGKDAYKEGMPIIERDPVAVIIQHPTEDLYLISKWKSAEWNGFLTGGIEEGDTMEETARREIHEETGFKNVSIVAPMDFVSHSIFFHPVKNENRLAHYHLVYGKLGSLDQDEVSEEEKNIADFVWVPYSDVLETLTRKGMKQLWEFYVKHLNNYKAS